MFGLNLMAIIIATIVMTVIGGVWFNAPFAFQRLWLAGIGKTNEQVIADFSPIKPILSLVGSAILATLLSVVLNWLDISGIIAGLQVGLIAAAFAVIPNGVRDAFEGRSLSLYLVNAAHDSTILVLASMIIGFFK
ncbi:MAG: DUF1761 domain-containing protein [Anaerolineae bacterium]